MKAKTVITRRFEKEIALLTLRKQYPAIVKKVNSQLRRIEKDGSWYDIYHLYSHLVGTYWLWGKMKEARKLLKQCENKFQYISTTATFHLAETYYWFLRDYRKASELAEEAMSLNTYYKAMYLKGLASFELGDMRGAIEALRNTKYCDLMLVEKLIERKIGLKVCRSFLSRALRQHTIFKKRGEKVDEYITKINDLRKKVRQYL